MKIITVIKGGETPQTISSPYIGYLEAEEGGSGGDTSGFLKADGSVMLAHDLNANENSIANLRDPVSNGDAANMGWVLERFSHVSANEYVHSQSVPSVTWNITHNLGTLYPNIIIINSAGDEVVGGLITPVNSNSLIINFGNAFGGTAYLR